MWQTSFVLAICLGCHYSFHISYHYYTTQKWCRTFQFISQNFSVHCKSKDDDLGNHVIHDIECYSWEFHPNVFGTTLFSCNISSTRGEVNNVFCNQKRDRHNRCPLFCDWYVTKDGIEGFKVLVDRDGWEIGTKQDIIFKWDPYSR